MSDQQKRLREIIVCALFVAITGILAQVSIPVPPVPFTGQTLAVGLTATIIGSRLGTFSMIGYMALGAVGVPVFSSFSAGLQTIVGQTGGFIIGFIPAAFIIGFILERTKFSIPMAIIANVIGMFVTLGFGVIQLKYVADLSWAAAFAGGVTPFIPLGLVKAVLAAWIGIIVRKRLIAANALPVTKRKRIENSEIGIS
ncbi:biotin transporter BioY [Aciduricibacillus chroicocephali]|uniref:Biotin transporter n=1 Tax=Aciduricibacillus chroicocephali TaxID=3054939 RepID=A0ABY9KVT8_9BACI|nr:biotin transporter BioY [Bacillaceae bacterium 44XB]